MATIWKRNLLTTTAWIIAAITGTTTLVVVGRGPVVKNATPTQVSAVQEVHLGLPIIAPVVATGSATVKTTGADGKAGTKYAAACIPNPLYNVGVGSGQTTVGSNSGQVLRLVYHNIYNPAAIGGDIGFVTDCNSNGTGATLIDDICTATGCVSTYTTGTAVFQGRQYIKAGLRGNPTSAFRATITATIEDILGE